MSICHTYINTNHTEKARKHRFRAFLFVLSYFYFLISISLCLRYAPADPLLSILQPELSDQILKLLSLCCKLLTACGALFRHRCILLNNRCNLIGSL